jgi:hypothetical protein
VSHQLGGSRVLGILVTIFAAADSRYLDSAHLFADRVAISLAVGTSILALFLVVALIVRVYKTAEPRETPASVGGTSGAGHTQGRSP